MTNNIRKVKNQGTTFEIFVISENEEYITGIKLSDLSNTDAKLIKERFKNHIPDKEIVSTKNIDGMEKEWADAIRKFKKSTPTSLEEKKSAEKYYEKAIGYEELKLYLVAIEDIKKAIRLDPTNTLYKSKLSELENKLKRPEAEWFYQDALKFETQEKYEEAVKCLEKAINFDSYNSEYKNKLKDILRTVARKSKDHYEKALNLEEEGKYSEAVEFMEKAIKLNQILINND